MRPTMLRQAKPTNAGLDRLDTPKLIGVRRSYQRLLGQIRRDPAAAGSTAELNVLGYLAEIGQALAAREAVAA